MVFDLLGLMGVPIAAGATIAIGEGIRPQAKHDPDKEEQSRMAVFHIDVFCNAQSRKRSQVDKSVVILKDGKLWLAPKHPDTNEVLPIIGETRRMHPFTGFFLAYNGPRPIVDPMFERLDRPIKLRGLVGTISKTPPTLNWIYVDRQTMELRYGGKEKAEAHIRGPWDWTEDGVGLTLERWEGFVAVEERKNVWALYYDRDDDGLRDCVVRTRVLQCSLERRLIDTEL